MARRKATPAARDESHRVEVPLVDLAPQHRPLQAELWQAVQAVAAHQRFVNGPEVELFEQEMSAYLGVAHAVAVSSGTDALLAALMALGVGPGDEVITTAYSFVATAEVIARLGARPVFCDILPDSLFLRPGAVREAFTSNTKVILAVHLFGRLGPVEELAKLAAERGVALVEDCAQALGARAGGRSAGSFGLSGAFSFFPSKNLGAWGDGGMVVTGDGGMAGTLRRLREHGQVERGHYQKLGGNFRLDTLQAAVLRVKLGHLERWLDERLRAAQLYLQMFWEAGLCAGPDETQHPGHRLVMPQLPAGEREHAFNLFVVRAEKRNELAAYLARRGIATAVYYRTPVPLQPCFADLGYGPGDFPVTEEACRQVLALPLFPGISPDQQRAVVAAVAEFYRQAD